jgi:hypothetical protein
MSILGKTASTRSIDIMPRKPRAEATALKRCKVSKTERQRLDEMLVEGALCEGARRQLRVMLLTRKLDPAVWEGIAYCPAGSFLETVAAAFNERTDIPLELPFFAAASMVAAHALAAGTTIDLRGQMITPGTWTIVLAGSGVGKSFAVNQLRARSGADVPLFPDASSSARYLDNLESHNRTWWVRDEFGQFLRNIELQTHMAEMRDYLLRTYDGTEIERNTKQNSQRIDEPALCLLGLTVDETWSRCVPADAMLDGFAQRFNFVMSTPRLDGTKNEALYDLSPWHDRLHAQWDAIAQLPLAPVYAVGDDAVAAYKEAFRRLRVEVGGQIPMSFFRRSAFSMVRYALVYHLVLMKTTPVLDAQDIGWAARVVRRHIVDGGKMIRQYGASDLEKKVDRVEQLLADARRRGGVLAPRDVVRHVYDVRHVQEARALLEFVLEDDPSATDEEKRVAAGGRRRNSTNASARAAAAS